MENHQIDVGEGGHLATAIAAVSHEGHLLLELRRIGSAQLLDQRPPHIIHNLVEQIRGQRAGFRPAPSGGLRGGPLSPQGSHIRRSPHHCGGEERA